MAYPVGTALLLGGLPGVRRAAYRATIGRLRNPDAVVGGAEAKLAGLSSKSQEFTAESKKLQVCIRLSGEEREREREVEWFDCCLAEAHRGEGACGPCFPSTSFRH